MAADRKRRTRKAIRWQQCSYGKRDEDEESMRIDVAQGWATSSDQDASHEVKKQAVVQDTKDVTGQKRKLPEK